MESNPGKICCVRVCGLVRTMVFFLCVLVRVPVRACVSSIFLFVIRALEFGRTWVLWTVATASGELGDTQVTTT